MKIADLKNIIENLPDDMPVGLWDLSTDSFTDGNYQLAPKDLIIEDYVKNEDDSEIAGQMLFITFENKLNENPINEL